MNQNFILAYEFWEINKKLEIKAIKTSKSKAPKMAYNPNMVPSNLSLGCKLITMTHPSTSEMRYHSVRGQCDHGS
jgi:hypothetical protein